MIIPNSESPSRNFCGANFAPKISLKNKTFFMIHHDASHVESPICIVAIINVQILQASTNNFLPNTS